MSAVERAIVRRYFIRVMVRFSLTALLVNVALSSAIFLITAYAFLLRSTRFNEEITDKQVSTVDWSGYLTRDREFCVLPNAIPAASEFSELNHVTLITQSSLQYLSSAVEQSQFWDGPISYALFVPSWTLLKNVHLALLALRQCSIHFRQKVSVHVFYPSVKAQRFCPVQRLSPNVLVNFSNCKESSVENLIQKLTPRVRKSKLYPVNIARNIAKKLATTLLTLVADVELIPSSNFAPMFIDFYKNRHKSKPREAFVVPVFELEYNRHLPRSKGELFEEAKRDLALPFHSKRIAYECHRMPNLGQWWHSGSSNESRMDIFLSTPWIKPCWEPVYLSLSSETPFYDERFRGYGKNKIQQVRLLADYVSPDFALSS